MDCNFKNNKPLYFTFYHKGEHYLRESMLRLDLPSYLYLKLKEAEYSAVFFVEYVGNQVRIIVRDRNSCGKNLIKKGFFGEKTLWENTYVEDNTPVTVYQGIDEDKVCDWLLKVMEESGNAVVAEISDLNAVFRNRQEQAAKLAALLKGTSHGTLTVTIGDCSSIPEAKLKEFTAPGSLMARLMPALAGAKPTEDLIRLLVNESSDGVFEPGVLNFPAVRMIIRHFAFEKHDAFADGRAWEDEFLNDYANVVYYWLYSPAMQKEVPGLIKGIRQPYTQDALAEYFCSSDGQKALEERVASLKRVAGEAGLANFLASRYGSRDSLFRDGCYLQVAVPALNRLEERELSDLCRMDSEGIYSVQRNDWEEMRRSIRTVRLRYPSSGVTAKLSEFLDILGQVERMNDINTQRRLYNVLMYCGNHLYPESAEQEEAVIRELELCEGYIDASRQVYYRLNNLPGFSGDMLSESVFSLAQSSADAAQLQSLMTLLNRMDVYFRKLALPDFVRNTDELKTLLESLKKVATEGADAGSSVAEQAALMDEREALDLLLDEDF